MAPDPSEKLFHGNANCSVRTSPPDFTDAQGSKYINNKLTVINNTFSAYLKKTENNIKTKPSKLYNIRKPYRWAEHSAEECQKALSSPKMQALIDNFLNNTYAYTNEGVNLAVKYMNYIFEKKSQFKLKTKNGKNQILKNDKNWFDQNCQTIRKNLRTLSNQKHNDQNNAEIRHLYCETLKQYKHTLRTKKAQYTKKQLSINSMKKFRNMGKSFPNIV